MIFSVLLGMFTVLFALGEKSGVEITPAQGVLHFCHVPKSLVEAARQYYALGTQSQPAQVDNQPKA